jgi:hypothetical protein
MLMNFEIYITDSAESAVVDIEFSHVKDNRRLGEFRYRRLGSDGFGCCGRFRRH